MPGKGGQSSQPQRPRQNYADVFPQQRSQNYGQQPQSRPEPSKDGQYTVRDRGAPATDKQLNLINRMFNGGKADPALLTKYGVEELNELTKGGASDLITELKAMK